MKDFPDSLQLLQLFHVVELTNGLISHYAGPVFYRFLHTIYFGIIEISRICSFCKKKHQNLPTKVSVHP